MSHPRPPFSARQLAEQVLAFREANAPDKHRFSEHALIVDNGRRGSDQKAVVFTGDDLSALLMDLRGVEADRDAIVASLTDELRRAKAKAEQYQIDWMAAKSEFGNKVAALRQRHAEAVELLVRASDMLHHTVFWTPDGEQHPHPDCPACQWQAAWPASEAKAALEADHIVGLGNMVEVARDGT